MTQMDAPRAHADDQDTPDHLRKPPHSTEAEQSVLGGLLLDPSAFGQVAEMLSADDFYNHVHKLVFGAIKSLAGDGKAVDVVTVLERLGDKAPDVGGLAYLHSLSMSVPSAAHILRYAEIIVERATLRSIIATANAAIASAYGAKEASSVIDDAKVAFGRLADQRKLGTQRMPLLGLGELREHSHAVSWLVKNVIPAESIGMLYGGSGTFKSFIALDAALHIAHGLPWMGRRTKQGGVLYIAAEGGAGLWARIVAWHRARRLQWGDVPFHVIPAAVNLTSDAWRVVEAAQSKGLAPTLVVIDTLSQTYAGEENSANEMAAYFRELGNRFRSLWQCAVLLLHHTGHQATERPRGSSAIRANLDFMLGVFRDEKEMLATLTCGKQKDGDAFDDATFALSVHELGTDEDGDKITSLVARHLTSAEELQDAMVRESSAGRGGSNQLLLSLLQNGAKESDVRKAFNDQCGKDTPEARRQAYGRARKWAEKNGFMEVSEGYILTLKAGA
jgi:plasmid stabilization system protein ParE